MNSLSKSRSLLSKTPKTLLNDLSLIKKVSLKDLHSFLVEDHTSFSVLSLSAKHIISTDRLTISLTKNSAKSFYLGPQRPQKSPGSELYRQTYGNPVPQDDCGNPVPQDDCAKDAQNCQYFAFFNSKEKKLYTRFKDKVEANFEGAEASGPLLFITLTFNTTQDHYSAWTTNWNPQDPCWNQLNQKQSWLKKWAQAFDHPAEASKIDLQKVSPEVSQYPPASHYLQKFLRRVRLQWKPSHWKWVVVSELQKNGIWHFHLLSTPIVPYSHRCTLDKNFTSCWNCRTYLSELWPYGRVQSKSPGQQTISSYLAKYLSKSFHLRSLYQQHGLTDKRRTYRFYLNLYDYEERAVRLVGQSRFDHLTQQLLPSHQKVFRRYDYQTHQTLSFAEQRNEQFTRKLLTYFYRTNEQLAGKCSKPTLIKKNFRLGTRSLQPLNLLKLANKPKNEKEVLNLKKPKSTYSADFQEHLITQLLFFCETAQFVQVPLEQEQVPQELKQCNQNISAHFKSKPLFHFTFLPNSVPLVLQFLDHLDSLAHQFDIESSADFYTWPLHHDQAHETLLQFGSPCGCEIQARNNYLHDWDYLASNYPTIPGPP